MSVTSVHGQKAFSFIRTLKNPTRKFFPTSTLDTTKPPLFSTFFLKFLQSINSFDKPSFWHVGIPSLLAKARCGSFKLFFTNYPKTNRKGKKSKLNDINSVFLLSLQAANYLLKLKVPKTLKTFFDLNEKKRLTHVKYLEETTRKIENINFTGNLNKILAEFPKARNQKIILALKKSLYYMEHSSYDSLLRLILLGQEFKVNMRGYIYKRFLMEPAYRGVKNPKLVGSMQPRFMGQINQKRIFLWTQIAKADTISWNYFFIIITYFLVTLI